ncbi:phosphodiesterase [Subtercola lobariae]|uniref:3',5'-cyclic adenosine monophosphate phosphodiesterase CpdA n=1 Tax=Subtercola lobariae TaxID=1588641 RepID=A0A917BF48_9MICO|nr:phosphodiesterase [Subtercola lobariae]GGF38774.1 3',5'-cyclic adenosine monophosphate phosphodiesterase CpdA [Subtercola lobariae]
MTAKAEPTHVIAHISDTHFLADEALLYGAVDTDATLKQILGQLEGSGIHFDALVFTGDIADLGEQNAYARIRSIVEPVAARLGAELVWVMGNHDQRARLRTDLLDEAASDDPVDRVFDLNGLRLIALDTSVPGYHHGELTSAQLTWLRAELAEPAPNGTLVALHHPPIPTTLPLMPILELQRQHLLADVIRGTDVRAILGGHLHYSTTSLFAGVPISVAAATCYTMNLAAERGVLSGVSGGQSINLVHVYDDQVVHSVVPVGSFPAVSTFPVEFVSRLEALSPEDQIEAFSRQVPPAS